MRPDIPRLQTERLILRGPRREDFGPYAGFWASDRSRHEGGPRGRALAWEDFAAAFGLWLIDGYGCWALEEKETGRFAGIVGLNHPAHFPEVEIGWTLMDFAEGRGLAFEAAQAVLPWVWANTALPSVTVYIEPENDRSIALAKRLGGVVDLSAEPVDEGDVVLRISRPAEVAA
ncbi:GNAT family N-acetyltransferase [Pseudoroseicyclus tamaricis]|uniref:GNAT family N-acetyltransferase n=1 Tax=Pseudoroseicyclus tamaricis TaxID=2705421 RepID=A0A6B2JF91_9RHOB|nr:GNAT family N-acetyltransferase [Pseudoroseicyclus tamaricis]NDU99662.1 GNAT family N-acetyltransferase [Pseudoroseicyclus tamaricis]